MAQKQKRGSKATSRRNSLPLVEVVERAREQVAQLTGRTPETVSAFEDTDDGWRVTVEVVELERIPPSTSVLASYEALLDHDANLLRYKRLRRYYQTQTDQQENES